MSVESVKGGMDLPSQAARVKVTRQTEGDPWEMWGGYLLLSHTGTEICPLYLRLSLKMRQKHRFLHTAEDFALVKDLLCL